MLGLRLLSAMRGVNDDTEYVKLKRRERELEMELLEIKRAYDEVLSHSGLCCLR